ncbi:MAG: XRE family transcriptional regulator [Candidatus Woesebacteria bacterium]|nr:XRE family transcriptional regulator [Candidatus Woesebacteria bacterium]
MITNERQYRITSAQLEKLRKAVDNFDTKAVIRQTKSKVLAKAELDALRSEYENLSVQLHEYETLKSGTVEILKASKLEELPRILIRARIAKRLSQRQLADAIGLKEQQIQRYEAEEYASANLHRLAEVAKALCLNISEIAKFRETFQEPINTDKDDLAWDRFPVKEMYRRNWFEGFTGSLEAAVANAEELVKEFVKGSLDKPAQAAARQRVRSGGIVDWYALLAWQCRIIGLAKKKEKEVAGKYKQKAISNEWLNELAHISIEKEGPKKVVDYLQSSGIRLVIEPHLPQTHLDGAAFLLSDDSPIIGMTLRYDRLDNFWFVLFHELVHIMKHLHKEDIESIFDDLDIDAEGIEQEADEQAGEVLVPEDKWNTALARYLRSKDSIEDFAKKLNIHPAIVAGKIRREAKNYIILTDMVGQGEVRKHFPNVCFF